MDKHQTSNFGTSNFGDPVPADDPRDHDRGRLLLLSGKRSPSAESYERRFIWLRAIRVVDLSDPERIRRRRMLLEVLLRLMNQLSTLEDDSHERAA
jgi:hypothetical protein